MMEPAVTEALPEWVRRKPGKNRTRKSQGVWYHTDAIFVGFRIVRPREIPTIEEVEKFWPSEEDIKASLSVDR